ncbi:WD40/YVTN/BNR-like repeat-containing protein [Eudoraea sp.]|uniref:WD40/YVTN/BNR-like repeat-containing protein n=1 Tax=Eudoraea sp. TaxID=1979955 RepID=UPI003C73FA02
MIIIRTVFFTFVFCFLSTICSIVYSQDFSSLEYRNVGPYRGGRVTAVAGIASKPSNFFLGATGGGVWKTEDYGTSWFNVSDGFFKTPSIGAIAVAQNDPNIVYVGTGSDGLRSNLIEGKGMYKSIDGGKTWVETGLTNVGQIGAIRIHPVDHNIVYVAALGRAFNSNPERGLFKTTDGGKTWNNILFISNKTGISDIEMMPTNPNILYAAAWKAERKPWTIISGGTPKEGGIYKSIDAGKNWSKIENGLPEKLIGKIDLEVCPADSKLLYALVEAPNEEGGLYISDDHGETFEHVSDNKKIRTRPFYYTNVKVDPQNSDVIYSMATDYMKSVDRGKTWSSLSVPHGDNHDMWINPENSDLFIQSNDGGANVTHNGGKSWSTQYNQPTSEIYQVEVDNQYPYWLYGGQQDNYSTVAVPSMAPYGIQAAGIGYIINTGGCETGPAVPHPTNPDIVYSNCKGRFTVFNKKTGTEKSFYVGASNMYGHNPKDLQFRFQRVSPILVSPHNPKVIYHTSQYVHKTTDEGKTWKIISPDLTAFETDKQVISGSPITRDITGEEFYSTIYAIQESPLEEGVIWVGANDGPVHVTRNGGKTWKNVTPKNLPPGGRVDAVEPSPHNPAKAYVCVLRYQLGDRKPYIYKTDNYGESWQLLTSGNNGIPKEYAARVVREDPEKEGLLFAGTEYGVFVSFNDGATWKAFQQNLPITPITDLKIHRGDLVFATMGRGFWILDDINVLRQENLNQIKDDFLFKPNTAIRYRSPSGARTSEYPKYPKPGVSIDYFLKEDLSSLLKLEILNEKLEVVNTYISDTTGISKDTVKRDMSTEFLNYQITDKLNAKKGFNRFKWDMTSTGPWSKKTENRYENGPLVKPGIYIAKLTIDKIVLSKSFEIVIDPRVKVTGISEKIISDQVDFQIKVRDLLNEALLLVNSLEIEQETLENKEKITEADKTKLSELKIVLEQLKTREGIYEQPMLTSQIKYLYNMMNEADQEIGKDALDRFIELDKRFQTIKESTN